MPVRWLFLEELGWIRRLLFPLQAFFPHLFEVHLFAPLILHNSGDSLGSDNSKWKSAHRTVVRMQNRRTLHCNCFHPWLKQPAACLAAWLLQSGYLPWHKRGLVLNPQTGKFLLDECRWFLSQSMVLGVGTVCSVLAFPVLAEQVASPELFHWLWRLVGLHLLLDSWWWLLAGVPSKAQASHTCGAVVRQVNYSTNLPHLFLINPLLIPMLVPSRSLPTFPNVALPTPQTRSKATESQGFLSLRLAQPSDISLSPFGFTTGDATASLHAQWSPLAAWYGVHWQSQMLQNAWKSLCCCFMDVVNSRNENGRGRKLNLVLSASRSSVLTSCSARWQLEQRNNRAINFSSLEKK